MRNVLKPGTPFYERNQKRMERLAASKEARYALVDYDALVRGYMKVYAENGSIMDLCDLLDITYHQATNRVERLKRNGVKLPPLRNANKPKGDEYLELNDLVAELMPAAKAPQSAKKKPPIV